MLRSILLFFLAGFLFPGLASAQEGLFNTLTGRPAAPSTTETFRTDKIDVFDDRGYLVLTLASDFDGFSDNRFEDKYQPALLTARISDSLESRLLVRIKPRGKSRKKNCDLPPIKLNLKKAGIINENFQSLEKLKVVSPCKKGKDYEYLLLKEYLVYKLFNVLTKNSFRVRLINMTLQDTGTQGWKQQHFGFIIEEGDALAKRIGLEYLNKFSLFPEQVNQDYYRLLALFQYMIGNPDWSVLGAQNLKTFAPEEREPENTFPIPYDFDVAAIVDAPYAKNPPTAQFKVLERPFLAPCLEEKGLQVTFAQMLEKEQDLVATIENFPYLPRNQKKKMIKFLDTFFKQLQKPGIWSKIDMPACIRP